ncbi:MAG TPA: hypothetical protein VF174_15925 [Micromonosporaceae bacterium]
MGVFYCSREDVKAALDAKLTARSDAQIDRIIEQSSRFIEGLTHRKFYPLSTTIYKDWPNFQYARSWRVWLDQHPLVSVTTITSGGVVIAATDYFLRPDDGPPYSHIEIDLDSSASFGGGSTHQRDIAILGVAHWPEVPLSTGSLGEDLTSGETDVDVSDSSAIGVGDIIRIDSERMTVTGRSMLDTGVDIDAGDSLTASPADVSITVSGSSGAPVVGETILIDSERMLVVDRAGLVLTVKRAWDGSVLATHAGSASIYAPRTLTVERGALGTTAATHSTSAAIVKHVAPVRTLCVAESVNTYLQETSGYAREVGSGDNTREASGRGLSDLREQIRTTYGRKARIRAV